jgi:hypothetical protein
MRQHLGQAPCVGRRPLIGALHLAMIAQSSTNLSMPPEYRAKRIALMPDRP